MRMAPALSKRRDKSTAFPPTSSNSWEGVAIPARPARRKAISSHVSMLYSSVSLGELRKGEPAVPIDHRRLGTRTAKR